MEEYGSFEQEGPFPLTRIPELPDAIKFARLDGHQTPKVAQLARQLSHYALHKNDLEFALRVLREINNTQSETVRRGLWHVAIMTFIKCFTGSSARISLDQKRIYRGKPEAILAFAYFDDLRNKHVVHDENSYTQCVPVAALNDGTKPFKVEKVIAVSTEGVTLTQQNWANLELLAKDALAWVTSKFDELCDLLTQELEQQSIDQLNSLPDIAIPLPSLADIGKRRSSA